ncbi:hypothetical protein TBLA_0B03660 [Henningerozyma blattae CBS 6284]|uniref:KOW domain-containing protein n=1 Tax=Henningerozyma blattae (strain ATCC 34711 / CBS 6284 / DSM 70876 / NBRC 10599 / NRRL Y-10934 / UCD 77-7) TaxID=1071380 RepID=I2GYK3_HENB6|nr:hypothetical protein TBLA_0B03660 [Tetrapisispora blattae CBS 6284]CCH59205.1 hypothetical protein TBLA_0B03660 [Tetrapisispora blattae CBS 6284]
MVWNHLSKAGGRVAKAVNNVTELPAQLQKHHADKLLKGMPSFLRPELEIAIESERFKTPEDWKYLPGDRVLIMDGPKKGNIAHVQSTDEHTNGFVLDEQGPSRKIAIPKSMWLEGQKSYVLSLPSTVTQNSLRLVADLPIKNPKTGQEVYKTVAIRDLEFRGTYYDEDYRKIMPRRCVRGRPDLVVPWPRPEPKDEETQEMIHNNNYDLITSPTVAREQSYWISSLSKRPIPRQAIPTIRNIHSKYKKKTLGPRDIIRLVAPKMPLTEAKKTYLDEKEKLSKLVRPKLQDEDIERIGSMVKKHLENF